MPKSNYKSNSNKENYDNRPDHELKAQAEYVSKNLQSIYDDYITGRSLEWKKIIESDKTMENVKNIMNDYYAARFTYSTLNNWNSDMKTGVL